MSWNFWYLQGRCDIIDGMNKIGEMIRGVIRRIFGVETEVEMVPSPENIAADYSCNVAMRLTKTLGRPPMEIAEQIAKELGAQKEYEVSVTAPGFINVAFTDDSLLRQFEMGSPDNMEDLSGKTVICEFSDPNPFKVLHVGHLYTSVVGEAISRLHEIAGAKVVRANFGGDVGLHVAKTLYALQDESVDEITIDDIARCYVEGTVAYEESEEARAEITRLNKEIYAINAEDKHGTKLADLYWRGRELSYEYFVNFYDSIGVKFDKFYPESTVAELGLETVRRELENGVYEKSDGAVIFDGEKYGLHKRVFINKEGVPTYEAKDVGLIFTKWNDYKFDRSVVITGNEQKDYMKVVLCSVEQYAPELVERTTHLTHGLVKLPGNVKMSSRKGNFLKAVDVLEMVRDELKAEYGTADEKIVMAAMKYAFLKYKMGGDIVFDVKESVKMTGNSGPYLLYSCVRAKKVLAKIGAGGGGDGEADAMGSGVQLEKTERNLMKKILEWKGELARAVDEMAPHRVATYLYELAQDFSRFYENCQVAGSEREKVRVELVRGFLMIEMIGLGILGIDVPEEM